MMTHVFEDSKGNKTIAAKGAPEALMHVSNLSEKEKQQIKHDKKNTCKTFMASVTGFIFHIKHNIITLGISNFLFQEPQIIP